MTLKNAFENLAVESKQLPDNHQVTVSNLSETLTPGRTEVAGLSFSETLGPLATFQTDWVSILDTNWLDIVVKVESTAAATAQVEYTDAADPNTTPPGADDVVRELTTTIGGTAVGGPANVVSFGLPAQMRWARLTVTDATGGQDIDVSVYSQDSPPTAAQIPLAASINPDFRMPIGRSVVAGEVLDAQLSNTTGFGNANLTEDGSLIVADPWRETFRETEATNGILPSGTYPTYDPVNPIVAANTIDTGWLDLTRYKDQFLNCIFDVTGVEVYVFNASDTSGSNSTFFGFGNPQLTSLASFPRTTGAPFFDRYFRAIFVNVSGSTSNSYTIRAMGGDTPVGGIFQTLDAPIRDFFPAHVTQNITKGRQPDGDYVATPADGGLAENTTPLGAAGTVTLGPFDTDGYKSIELYIATDQVSAGDGICIEYTPDSGAASPVYYPGPKFTYSAVNVSQGFLLKRFSPALDGFRIVYTNGGSPQGSFLMSLTVRNAQTENPSTGMEEDLDESLQTLLMRGVDFAQNDLGVYGNITRGPLGGKRVSVYEHESDTPIKSLNSLSGNATSVGSGSATPIATSAPAGTKSITIQGDPDNTKIVDIGFNASVTSGNAPYALSAGDAIVFEVDGTPTFYAISASGSQSVRWVFAAEV